VKKDKTRPFVLYVAEVIYLKVSEIKKQNLGITNIEAIERFIGTDLFKEISSGKFHDKWFKELKKNNFIDKNSGKKIPSETIRLLVIQKDTMMRQLIGYPSLYYTKSFYPLELSQRSFNHLWRICENYELWCNEVGKKNKILLKLFD
tara:strand:- start:122 stop:562 length:441 start_codon:yes stop_codon:yes gene_type:complete